MKRNKRSESVEAIRGAIFGYQLPRLFLAAVLLVFFVPSFSLQAQTRLTVHGAGRLYPIAIPQLCLASGESDAVKEIPSVIARNLDLSGFFDVLNPNTFIEEPGRCAGPDGFAYSDWQLVGAEGLVRGEVTEKDGQLSVRLFLHDIHIQRVVLGKEYTGDADQARRIAHRFSNEIINFFTGEMGVFGSRMVFSGRVGRFKELFMMDMDGSNLRQLTQDRSLALAASWHPLAESLIFTTYRNRLPNLYTLDLPTRAQRQITQAVTLELGGKYSRDGQRILLSRSVGRESDIVLMDRSGVVLRHLTTNNGAIDVSPDWSPDNSRIVFCSDRGGPPQIYTMNADGSGVRRVSYVTSNYCTSPVWSPRGDRIAFVCRADGGFQIFTANPDGGDPLQLTSLGNNEDPTWSPDGRYLAFASTFGRGRVYNIAMVRADGGNLRQLTHSKTGDTAPAWGPRME